MGEKDLVSLHKIYEEAQAMSYSENLGFNFKVDDGQFETRIDIREDGSWNKGDGKLPLIGSKMLCPDLIDFNKKKIIEYEESAAANTGYLKAKRNKGHSEVTNKKDTDRDLYYKIAGFDLLKIWDYELKDDGLWIPKLFKFLKK